LIAGAFQPTADQQGDIIIVFDEKEFQGIRHGRPNE